MQVYNPDLITTCTFVTRLNRFVARVILDESGEEIDVHVKNTGRCKELLVPGCRGYLLYSTNPHRKYAYDFVAVYKRDLLVNFDSQIPNKVVLEFLKSEKLIPNLQIIKPEVKFGNSRFDIYMERLNIENKVEKIFLEVKGVTLFEGDVAMFPDAPTVRGVKHLNELITCLQSGYRSAVFFLIQATGLKYFKANREIDPDFANALYAAKKAGVEIYCFDTIVTCDRIDINNKIEILWE